LQFFLKLAFDATLSFLVHWWLEFKPDCGWQSFQNRNYTQSMLSYFCLSAWLFLVKILGLHLCTLISWKNVRAYFYLKNVRKCI